MEYLWSMYFEYIKLSKEIKIPVKKEHLDDKLKRNWGKNNIEIQN